MSAPEDQGGTLLYKDLALRWRVGVRQARRIAKEMKVPQLKLGHRTVRFRPVDVERAEAAAAGHVSRARFQIV